MYELLYIVPAPYTEKDLEGISQKIKKIISDLEGTITHEENLGSKKLSYPIKTVYRGFYLLIHFEIGAKKTKELNQKLKLTSEILRYMITVSPVPKPQIKKVKQEKEKPVDIFEEELQKKEIGEKKEDKEERGEKPRKPKKLDLKKLSDKIDKLLKI